MEVFESFIWNDSALSWVLLSEAFLCYLYRRYIEEHIVHSQAVVCAFIAAIVGTLAVCIVGGSAAIVYSPLAPTVLFLIIWCANLAGAAARFHPRACRKCGACLDVSVYDKRFRDLYGGLPLWEQDVWFCPSCAETEGRGASERMRCSCCNCTTAQDVTLAVVSPPSRTRLGVSSVRSCCSICGAVALRRRLLRPLLRGREDETRARERSLIGEVDRLAL